MDTIKDILCYTFTAFYAWVVNMYAETVYCNKFQTSTHADTSTSVLKIHKQMQMQF